MVGFRVAGHIIITTTILIIMAYKRSVTVVRDIIISNSIKVGQNRSTFINNAEIKTHLHYYVQA